MLFWKHRVINMDVSGRTTRLVLGYFSGQWVRIDSVNWLLARRGSPLVIDEGTIAGFHCRQLQCEPQRSSRVSEDPGTVMSGYVSWRQDLHAHRSLTTHYGDKFQGSPVQSAWFGDESLVLKF